MTQWSTSTLRAVRQAATRSHGAHRGFVEIEDLQQEGYLWCLSHPEHVERWDAEGREGFAQLQQSLYHHMHRYTMRQRYEKDGTKPDDYYVYQIGVIAELMPDVLSDSPSYGSSSSDLNGLVKSGRSLAEGGDRMAMIADIKVGLSRLSEQDKELLIRRYSPGADDQKLSEWYEIPVNALHKRVTRALRKIAKELGSEPVRRRRAMSNAQAQHITREQE